MFKNSILLTSILLMFASHSLEATKNSSTMESGYPTQLPQPDEEQQKRRLINNIKNKIHLMQIFSASKIKKRKRKIEGKQHKTPIRIYKFVFELTEWISNFNEIIKRTNQSWYKDPLINARNSLIQLKTENLKELSDWKKQQLDRRERQTNEALAHLDHGISPSTIPPQRTARKTLFPG